MTTLLMTTLFMTTPLMTTPLTTTLLITTLLNASSVFSWFTAQLTNAVENVAIVFGSLQTQSRTPIVAGTKMTNAIVVSHVFAVLDLADTIPQTPTLPS
eukprot:CAMPEP_0175072510 /NCGR_PEP_ID=MMETSP0052_2-20121109/19959_1 /TAXON_ID=51329 ORGANISM="Polytomella parva, Strain SAG 63-3" /NCGR_SAMPLE_ID=MMETSP0052_2 /ASSEMBLY_ACC=CAM_ASM_000194 /LENGTH=98 /DNA_ID=CAMNT_0016340041 /DNA_START=218 /DNA_END=510 /DNA_ORIENTATION=+